MEVPLLSWFWISAPFLGMYVSLRKRLSSREGFVLGLLFGPLGVLVAALLPTILPTTVVAQETLPSSSPPGA